MKWSDYEYIYMPLIFVDMDNSKLIDSPEELKELIGGKLCLSQSENIIDMPNTY